jgi:hypothetical protein
MMVKRIPDVDEPRVPDALCALARWPCTSKPGRLVADVTRGAPGLLDVAVGVAEPDITVEPFEDASPHFELRARVVDAIEISQILRTRVRIEHEEVGSFRLRVVDAEVGADAPGEELGLGARFDGIRPSPRRTSRSHRQCPLRRHPLD